jgi:membrane protein implicated in regulation of membrane protease activity
LRISEAVSTLGKIIFAVVLAYIGLAVSSLVGGFIVGVLGAALQLSPTVACSLVWWLPKIIFAGMLLFAYIVWRKRRRANEATTQANAKNYM